MNSVNLIAFRDELQKIAMSLDADTRNNMAMRHEVPDTLLEGRLFANDGRESGFIPKLGEPVMDKVRSGRDQAQEKYRDLRKPGGAALKGGFTGAFLGQMLTGGNLGGTGWKKRLGLRGFGALGAGAGLTDHYAQKKYRQKDKTAMMGSETFTPGRSLTQARNVGSFQSKLIHKGDRLRPATMGNKFQIPQG